MKKYVTYHEKINLASVKFNELFILRNWANVANEIFVPNLLNGSWCSKMCGMLKTSCGATIPHSSCANVNIAVPYSLCQTQPGKWWKFHCNSYSSFSLWHRSAEMQVRKMCNYVSAPFISPAFPIAVLWFTCWFLFNFYISVTVCS